MTFIPKPLPVYPVSAGPAAARRLQTRRAEYQRYISAIDVELKKAEKVFTEAFGRADEASNTQSRIDELAGRATRAKYQKRI